MQAYPLTLVNHLKRARAFFPHKQIVSKLKAGVFRYTYRDFTGRVAQLAGALRALGIAEGDRVGTLAWNSYRHLELYYAVPCMGAVLHTANLRLPRDQIAYIINHAEDKILFLDEDVLPLVEGLSLTSVRNFVVMLSDPNVAMPKSSLVPAHNTKICCETAPPLSSFRSWTKICRPGSATHPEQRANLRASSIHIEVSPYTRWLSVCPILLPSPNATQ